MLLKRQKSQNTEKWAVYSAQKDAKKREYWRRRRLGLCVEWDCERQTKNARCEIHAKRATDAGAEGRAAA